MALIRLGKILGNKAMVYLICFQEKFKHAKHYIGYTANARTFRKRLKYHETGQGSRLLKAVTEAGIHWLVTRTWDNADGHFERKLKKQKNSRFHCPRCKALNKKKLS